jgi:hypothetical protein
MATARHMPDLRRKTVDHSPVSRFSQCASLSEDVRGGPVRRLTQRHHDTPITGQSLDLLVAHRDIPVNRG